MKTPEDFAKELAPHFEVDWGTNDINGTEKFIVDTPEMAELIAARDAEIRQACAAEYQPRLEELKAAIEAAVMAERKMWQGRESEGYRQHLLQRVTDADAIIDEARQLAGRWKREPKWAGDVRAADELEAVLDRSGARGGSVAASPASSPDNPPTNTDRSGI